MQAFTRKIGKNRGRSRLWIEGAHLTAAGFAAGDKWQMEKNSTGFDIVRAADGSRKISGTADRPIIDIAGAALGALAEGCAMAALTYTPGAGLIHVVAA
jgi:hypothetical protein